jgi:DNA-binding CsgD family transcriptional regulator
MSLPEITELSERERDILRLVATGAGNKQIAAQLFISTNTVKVHLRNIFSKIGVTSRTEAAMAAIRLGLVQSEAVGFEVESAANNSQGDRVDLPSLAIAPAGQVSSLESQFSSMPKEMQAGPVYRGLSGRWTWLLGVALLVLAVLLVIFGFRLARPQTGTLQSTLTPGPQITALPRWQTRTGMPAARTGLAVVAYDEALYAIGGESAAGIVGAVERYDPESDSWESLLPKPVPVTDIQAVVIGGKIFVPGGRTVSGSLVKNLDIYDPGLNLWEQGVELPQPLSAYALSAFEGRLYLFGGWDGSKFTNLAFMFDPRSNQWTELTPMPTSRGFAGAAVAGGKIYIIGGNDGQAGLASVEVYSPDNEGREDPWHTAAPMPSDRYGMGITSVADIIYVICGQGSDDIPLLPLAYVSQKDTWQTFDIPPVNLGSGLGLALSGEYLYAVGGKRGASPVPDVLAYQVIYTVGIPVIIK